MTNSVMTLLFGLLLSGLSLFAAEVLSAEAAAGISLSSAPTETAAKPPRLALQAILGRKAVISLNGKRSLLAVGETSEGGLRLQSLSDTLATVEFAGRLHRLRLGQAPIAAQFATPQQEIVTIAPDRQGMYTTGGAINGHAVLFLVDTGATTVAMNADEARRLGVDYRLRGRPVQVSTASGQSRAYFVELREVSVGNIRAHNVGAVVLEGGYPQQVLLGMSFLGQLQLQHRGQLLELRQ